MPGIQMPGESELPAGPRRTLVAALHELYGAAGKPSTRWIAATLRSRDDLPGTLSHAAVSEVLRGAGGLPAWPRFESLVTILAESSVRHVEVRETVLNFQRLWLAADTDQGPGKPSGTTIAVGSVIDGPDLPLLFGRLEAIATDFLELLQGDDPWFSTLQTEGVAALAQRLAAECDDEGAEVLLEAEQLPLESLWKGADEQPMALDLFILAAAALRPSQDLIEATIRFGDAGRSSWSMNATFAMAGWSMPTKEVALLMRRLKSRDATALLLMASVGCCLRSTVGLAEVIDLLYKMGPGGASDFVRRIILMKPIDLLLPLVRELREIGNGKIADSLLWEASRKPSEEVAALLAILRDEYRQHDSRCLIESAAWRSPTDICTLVDVFRAAGRKQAAEDLLGAVLRTGPVYAVGAIEYFREVGRNTDLRHILSGVIHQFAQAEMVTALELIGFSEEAEIIQASQNYVHRVTV
ncbi:MULTISPECIES: hypothetical protein [Kitasatospora]|uniref:hypothetical protein n=1 Tax=Kitasatospora TaxID=2063 RepID=UPI000CA66D10|nr:hypothetical protein [Kitasatospora sp. GP30]MDH6139865.1 hypothetical protein [Kitasatospora sp. GP30]